MATQFAYSLYPLHCVVAVSYSTARVRVTRSDQAGSGGIRQSLGHGTRPNGRSVERSRIGAKGGFNDRLCSARTGDMECLAEKTTPADPPADSKDKVVSPPVS